ncbi:MAG: extracellular solute-binding protein [Clostridia bacterium]|nr:extracellular solute-binding protein [Clostridia bacterium]
MKKLFALLLVLALAVSLFAACGEEAAPESEKETESAPETTPVESEAESETEPESEPASEEAGEITLRTTFASGELYAEQIELYQLENPGVTIEQVDVDTTKLISMVAAGTAPDLIRIYAVQTLPFYVTRGLAGDYVDDIIYSGTLEYTKPDDFLPVIGNYKYDLATNTQGEGKVYGLVKDFSNDVAIFAWKAHLDEAGIEYDPKVPFTWQQVGEYAKKLTIKDGNTITRFGACAYDGSVIDHMRLMVWCTQLGGSAYSDDFSEPKWDSEEVTSFLEWAIDLVKDGAIASPLHQPEGNSYTTPFLTEGFSMLLCGYWYTGSIRSNENTKDRLDDLIFLPTPQQEGKDRVSFTTAACGGIALRQSQNPEATVKFMDYFFSGPPATDRAKGGWGIPMYKSMLEMMPAESNFDKQCLEVVYDEMDYMNMSFRVNPYIGFDTVTALIAKYIAPVWEGESTIDAAVASINADLVPLIQEGMEIAQ